ncbi:hypothetical protein ABES25_23550, partial [Bacillus gobiensis]
LCDFLKQNLELTGTFVLFSFQRSLFVRFRSDFINITFQKILVNTFFNVFLPPQLKQSTLFFSDAY